MNATPMKPRFSIIVPALNEEAALPDQLGALLSGPVAGGETELIVVDGGSEDRTRELAEELVAGRGRVIAAPRGRARQMNAGAAVARGDTLIFLHADTRLPPDTLAIIERALTPAAVVGGAFRLRFDTDAPLYRLVAASANLRCMLRHVYTGDQAYAIRREAFERVGGFPEQPLMEDFEMVRRLRTVGRFVLFPAAVTTSARRHQRRRLGRSLMIMGVIRVLYGAGVSPARLAQLYRDVR